MHRDDAFDGVLPTLPTAPDHSLECAFAFGTPRFHGRMRAQCADFEVSEILGFEPDDDGDHLLLYVEKEGITTSDLVAVIARAAGLATRQVGYCGMKDRQALARQWLSIPVAGRAEPNWALMAPAPAKILVRARHRRKLKRGSHRANAFKIRVLELHGGRDDIDKRLCRIGQEGVPNYFGPQRFGRQGRNIERADAMLKNALRPPNHLIRGMYLSALRAWLFNAVLSERVSNDSWNRLLPGDCAMLDGTRSVFSIHDVDAELAARAQAGDIHPTGPLVGTGKALVHDTAQAVEEAILADYKAWRVGLAQAGLRGARRSLRATVRQLVWTWESETTLCLSFILDRGQFATSVVRECFSVD